MDKEDPRLEPLRLMLLRQIELNIALNKLLDALKEDLANSETEELMSKLTLPKKSK